VSEAFIKRFFKSDEDPIGQHFGIDLPQYASTFQVIGIVRDAKFASFALNRPALPMFFVPITQFIEYKEENMRNLETRAHFAGGLVLKTNTPSGTLEPIIRKTLSDIDPDFTVSFVRTLQDQIALSFSQRRAVASLAALFGVVALLLAAIGLYGVTAYGVAQRTSEIGVRIALGATRWSVIGMILRGASLRVLIGLAFGVPLAIGAGHLISAQLYGVSSSDPLALLAAAFTLAAAAFIAALIPARRAASISPMDALRNE
jgi:ABC-type antimicrobial peptide transport system permease subunit